ncbi:MAG: mannosyltransferase [Actinomycetota bacterium]|nr:mannosyltransferase [Actinomycetota bacterium]
MAIQLLERPVLRRARVLASPRSLPVLLGFVGFLISFAASWVPSFWGDEAASVMSAERSIPSLFRMLTTVDAVHGTYYLLLHFWIGMFGSSELSVRLPSALAIAAAVSGTYLIGKRLAGRRTAIAAAIVMAVMPRTTFMGAEARSSALATAIAVWLTVLLIELVQEHTTSRQAWIAYSILLTIGIYVFLYMVLLAVAHGVYVLLVNRQRIVRLILATILAVVASAPVAYFSLSERQQVAFLVNHPPTLQSVFVSQWFDVPWVAAAAWAAIVAGLVVAWRRRDSRLVAVALPWLVVPTLILVLASFLVIPSYDTRYVSLSVPGVALLIGAGVAAIPWRRASISALGLLVLLSVPSYVVQRGQYAKDGGNDWRQASAFIAAHAHPGDAVMFDNSVRPSRTERIALRVYPQYYVGLQDVELSVPFQDTSGLWDQTVPIRTDPQRLRGVTTVWLLDERHSADDTTGTDRHDLAALGFSVDTVTVIHRSVVYELTRPFS